MKYIILGKSLKKGTIGNDSSDLSVYFELGWEVVGSRIDIINLLASENIDTNNTTLVTTQDRKFMYSKFFDKTISYEDFLNVKTTNDVIEDWTISRNFRFLNAYNNFVDLDSKKYLHYDRDYDLIFNGYDIQNSTFNNQEEKFVVLALRYREHNSHKNAYNNLFEELVRKIKSNITKNIFVVGYGSESFCNQNDCVYIDKLVDYVSLIKDKNCVTLISQSTGTLCLALTSSETHIQLIDHTRCSELNGDNAVLGGRCVHFFSNGISVHYDLNQNTIDNIFLKTQSLCLKK
jgi:hypothetical protein